MCQLEDADNYIKCSNSSCRIAFCKSCFLKMMKNKRSKCPNCPSNFEQPKGFTAGSLRDTTIDDPLPGYDRCKTIEFYYFCDKGIQTVSFTKSYCFGELFIFILE